MDKNRVITVQNVPITISITDRDDYIYISDMASAKIGDSRSSDVIKNWLRNRKDVKMK